MSKDRKKSSGCAVKENKFTGLLWMGGSVAAVVAVLGLPLLHVSSTEKKLEKSHTQYANAVENKIKEFIAKGGDVNAHDKNGQTLLLKAIKLHNNILAKELIKAGADVNMADNNGTTPLIATILYGNEEMFNSLSVNENVDAQKKNNEGLNALMVWIICTNGSTNGKLTVIKNLIARGADVNAQTNDGTTPLMLCAAKGNYGLYLDLVKYGANVLQQDNDGKTAVDYAYLSDKSYVYEHIEKMEKNEQLKTNSVKKHQMPTFSKMLEMHTH